MPHLTVFRMFAALLLSAGLLAGPSGCATDGALAELEKLAGSDGSSGPLSTDDIINGLKEALTNGSTAVVGQLGRSDGFNGDPAIRIPLPDSLNKARDIASKVGLAGSFDDLEVRLNRAAENATPKARSLFVNAIRDMSVQDARDILRGPDDAATQYFRDNTQVELAAAMRPIVDNSLSQVGAVREFQSLMQKYNSIPLAPRVDADLSAHVVEKAMDGIFQYIAVEEKSIRENPLKRTSQLLQRVFGAGG